MGKFNVSKRVSLAFLGEQHKEDYLSFSQFSYRDAKELVALSEESKEDTDKAMEKLIDKFIEGRFTDEVSGEQLPVDKEDLQDLPVSAINHSVKQLVGVVEENL